MLKKNILLFGVGELQRSIIERAHKKNIFVVGIDPDPDAVCRNDVDVFVVVDGKDYQKTLEVAKKYSISGVVTAATDKPLVMMARIAAELRLPFYSVETAERSTDKYKMKQCFLEAGIPCAQGRLATSVEDVADFNLPVIVKPRDSSGSRGVKLCKNREDLQTCLDEALQYSHLSSVLVEEFIDGMEYSIESLHYAGKTDVLQFTEKRTTPFPYNVELGHKQPANLTTKQCNDIRHIINNIAAALHFENCSSHTELKINDRGIFVIETSPRLGGDYITSALVPLSTGINMEDQMLNIALGDTVDITTGRMEKASGICFFSLPEGRLKRIDNAINDVLNWPNVVDFKFKLRINGVTHNITNSLDRYGYLIVSADNRQDVDHLLMQYENTISDFLDIE
ncbi:ATP-grasp domain-containing protein [Treponema vincentii]|uniref:ATP-grasp domain-containing protein n=1 Tax=Treponema vincentii TaxID=69710 RepID=UPI0020A3385E|nr:ATP-grasp domain-containing protein [Treponema vincentii]UTC48236.1 ATP-grasp domain-containing protein [Treponema vincentii]